jgi:uncharacterized membrane protein YkvA (DUF1232 family)
LTPLPHILAFSSKRKGVIFLITGIIYAIYPLDIIPDILGPMGWVDDMG